MFNTLEILIIAVAVITIGLLFKRFGANFVGLFMDKTKREATTGVESQIDYALVAPVTGMTIKLLDNGLEKYAVIPWEIADGQNIDGKQLTVYSKDARWLVEIVDTFDPATAPFNSDKPYDTVTLDNTSPYYVEDGHYKGLVVLKDPGITKAEYVTLTFTIGDLSYDRDVFIEP